MNEWHKATEERLKQSALKRLEEDLDRQIVALQSVLQEQEREVAAFIAQRDANMQHIQEIEAAIKANKLPDNAKEMEEIQQMMLQLNSFSARIRTQHKLQY